MITLIALGPADGNSHFHLTGPSYSTRRDEEDEVHEKEIKENALRRIRTPRVAPQVAQITEQTNSVLARVHPGLFFFVAFVPWSLRV